MAGKNGLMNPIIAGRLARCRRVMAEKGVPAYLITSHMDSFYLSGFTGEDSALLVTPKAVHVISDGRFDETIDHEIPWAKKHLRKGLLTDEIANVCRKLKLDRVAVQQEGMTVATHAKLRSLTKPVRLTGAPSIALEMRRCKDETELSVMNRAIRIAEEAFSATRRSIRVGQTEREIAARLEFEMRNRGADAQAFDTIIAVDGNASRPHARAGDRRVKKGSAILFDWGARVGFYHSDLTRVLFVSKIQPRLGKVYEVVLNAQLAAIQAIRPGERMCDVDAVARDFIGKAGYGDRFGHGLGHGLGLDVHEAPSLSWRSKERLTAGMVVTVEPGIYLPGVGGVRIEDDVLVTADGCRVLSRLAKDLKGSVL
ncbi:MAG: aminopeptidase P family protein [Phycisphaerales bacterium]|nr:aminopeptidase P family protein [Phycisphaerales bacterium]